MERRIQAINRVTVGWTAYFAYAETPRPFGDLDEWLRRRLPQIRWKEWKRYRTRRRNLRALGIAERAARDWAGSAQGLLAHRRLRSSTARCRTPTGTSWPLLASAIPIAVSGTRCEPPDADPHVRWCGRGRDKARPYRSGEGASENRRELTDERE
jgi:Group II intron, maturase-specific domain